MARIRTIKPEFWTNEDLAETSEAARLLAIGLLNHSDDEGYFKAHKSLIKAVVFPLTEPSLSIHGCLKQLSNANYIRLFRGSDGKEYGKVINFAQHQVVNRPKQSKIKPLETDTDITLKDHGSISDESSLEGNGREQGREQDLKSCTPGGDAEPAIVLLPTNKHNTEGEEYPVTQSQIDEWQEVYPAVNCLAETKQAKLWLKANPSKRKTYGGMAKFLNGWMSRQQNKGGSSVAAPSPAPRPSHRSEMPRPDRPPRREQ